MTELMQRIFAVKRRFLFSRHMVAAWSVFAILLTVALGGALWFQHEAHERLKFVFASRERAIESNFFSSLDGYQTLLKSFSGLILSSHDVTTEEWHDFVNNMSVEQVYPAFLLLGRVNGAGGDKFSDLLSVRTMTYLSVSPEALKDPEYAAAMAQSRQTREAAFIWNGERLLSAFGQKAEPALAAVLYFDPGQITAEHPGGYIIAFFSVSSLVDTVLSEATSLGDVGIEIRSQDSSRIFASHVFSGTPSFADIRSYDVHNNKFDIMFRALPNYGRSLSRYVSGGVAVLGTALSIAIFAFLYLLTLNRYNAQQESAKLAGTLGVVETESKERKHVLEFFIKHFPSPIAMLDNQMRYLYCSDPWLKFCDMTMEQIRGKPYLSSFDRMPAGANPVDRWDDECQRAVQGATIINDRQICHTAIGEMIYISYKMYPWYSAKNEIGGVIINTDVINEKVAAEEKAGLYQSRLEAILDNMVDGLITINDQGAILSFNKACEKIFGYTVQDVVGKNISMLMPAAYADNHDGYLTNYMTTGQKKIIGSGREVEGMRNDKSTFPLDLSVAEVNVGGKRLFSGIIRDITERKKYEDELRRSNKDLERFAYVASHDLKAPLRGIDNLARWIEEDSGDAMPQDARDKMGLLRGRVTRLERLLDDILTYSRAGRLTENTESVDLNEIVEGLKVSLPQGFVLRTEGHLPTIESFRTPLEQIFTNLIMNAVRHHDKGEGTVTISARQNEGFYGFVIADDGPGIAPEFHERIFDMFQTLQPRDKREGSGLGLAIVKKLVEWQGGSIHVQSPVADGRGTAIIFSWPMKYRKEALKNAA